MNIEKLRELNPQIEIYSVESPEFASYGRKLNIDTNEIVKVAQEIALPESGSLYEASVDSFENLKISKRLNEDYFGEMETQVGYCYGHSNMLNAFEWHKSSEINIAVTDLILILAHNYEIIDGKIDSALAKVFYVKKGEAIEVFGTSLHFCPIEVSKKGFGCVVALPKGTNLPLDNSHEDRLLFRKNKWIIAHIDNKPLIDRGVIPGVYGSNIEIKY